MHTFFSRIVLFLFFGLLSGSVFGQTVSVTHPTSSISNDGSITITWTSSGAKAVVLNGVQQPSNVLYFDGLGTGDYTLEYLRKNGKNWVSVGSETVSLIYGTLGSYCESSGNVVFDTGITLVDFNSINNSSGKSSGYDNYTSISTDVVVGNTYGLTVNVNTDGDWIVGARAWIDWNQNGDFSDAGEEFNLGSARNTSDGSTDGSPYSITIPSGASLGVTRMRISAKYNSYANECDNDFDGEAEDYTLVVKEKNNGPTVADCLGAKTICDAVYDEPSPEIMGQGNVTNELPSGDCVPDEKNGIWYSFSPQNTVEAELKFMITPNNNSDDYDWIIFDVTDVGCEGLAGIDVATSDVFVSGNTYGANRYNGPTGANTNNVSGFEKLDNCNGPGTDNGPIWNRDILVKPGHHYVLYVSNWSESSRGYTINFEQGGTAIIYDDVPPNLAGVVQACYGSNELEVKFTESIRCGTLQPENMKVSVGTTTYEVTNITSADCAAGSAGSDTYILTLDRNIANTGTFTLTIESSGIEDMCGNLNTTESILPFEVSEITATLTADKNPACIGDNVTIKANALGGTGVYTYEFFLNGNPLVSNAQYVITENQLSSNVFAEGDVVKVNVTDEHACLVTSLEATINISPQPKPIGIFY